MALFQKFEHRVERVCLVDKPLDYPFLPDRFFSYMADHFPRLQFIYMRELDVEKINRGTVVKLANHEQLKKVIVHGCRNYEVLQDFHALPQLLVVKGEIQGLKVMLGDCFYMEEENSVAESSSSSATSASATSAGESSLRTASAMPSHSHQTNGLNSEDVDSELSNGTTDPTTETPH